MTLNFDRFTFQLCNSEEQRGSLSVIALFSTVLLSTPVRSVLVELLSKLTIDRINNLDLDKRSHLRWIHVYVLIPFIVITFQSDNINDTLKKWHNEILTTYHFRGMFLTIT